MLRIFYTIRKASVLMLASVAYLFILSVSSANATKIVWHYHDMHGEMTGAPVLTDPLTVIVTFLIILAIGLTIWVAKRNDQTQKKENKDGDKRILNTSQ